MLQVPEMARPSSTACGLAERVGKRELDPFCSSVAVVSRYLSIFPIYFLTNGYSLLYHYQS